MQTYLVSAAVILTLTVPSLAQNLPPAPGPATTEVIIETQPNTTGNDRSLIIAPGATGAETITTDSAAGGNAGQPSRAIPQGSADGGGDGG